MNGASSGHFRHLIIQPDDGVEPVRALIASAQKSIRLKQFTFTEPSLQEAIIERHRAGVDVRLMLNPQRSSGSRANDEAFTLFQSAGVPIKWTSSKFVVTHEKSIVIDDERALIATFNLCLKYFTQTRDYGVVVVDPEKVEQVAKGFEADWEERDWVPDNDCGLLWSNRNARVLMARFIDRAEERLDVQHPKFVDATVLERLIAAAKRGVHVRVLCGGKHGISEWDILDTFSSLRVLHHFGVKVHKQKNLRLHAKLLLADGAHALVGSMNIDRSAFDLRRELGTTITDPTVVEGLEKTFASDWEDSHRYEVPDPLEVVHPEEDFAHDPDLSHE